MRKIKRNRIRCKQCNDIIESLSIHDLKFCGCRKVAVDGGLEYIRRIFPPGANPKECIEELSEWE